MRLRLHWTWLVPVLLLTTFLGSLLLTYDALWFDEWITHFITNTGKMGFDDEFYGASTVTGTICEALGNSTHTPLHILCLAAIDNSWPPLFFALVRLWSFVSGGVYYIDRSLALFIGLIGISMNGQQKNRIYSFSIIRNYYIFHFLSA